MKRKILYSILNEWRDEDLDDLPIDLDDLDFEPTSLTMTDEPDLEDDDFVLSTNINTDTFFDDLVNFINKDLFLKDYRVKKDKKDIQGVYVKYTQKIPINEHTSKTPDVILHKIREFIEKTHYEKTQERVNGYLYPSIDNYIRFHSKQYKRWYCWEYADPSDWKNRYIERDKDYLTPLSTPIQVGEVLNFQYFFIHVLKTPTNLFETLKVQIECKLNGVVALHGYNILCYHPTKRPSIDLVVRYELNNYKLPKKGIKLTLISDVVDEYTEDEVREIFMNKEPLNLKL